jgi:DinB superfamily/PDZ domain
LQKGDVIVRAGRQKILGEQDLMKAYLTWKAGQRVPFAVIRAGKRKTITVELGKRSVPEIPDDPAALIEQVRQTHEQAIAALRTAILMITDEQAGLAPAEGEWSVKQVLAHLTAAERGFHAWVANVLIGEQTPITGHLPEQFAAILVSAPTAGALVDRFERDLVESRAIVASLTPEHCANKWRYRQIAQQLVGFGFHTQDHIEQIQKTVRAVTGK